MSSVWKQSYVNWTQSLPKVSPFNANGERKKKRRRRRRKDWGRTIPNFQCDMTAVHFTGKSWRQGRCSMICDQHWFDVARDGWTLFAVWFPKSDYSHISVFQGCFCSRITLSLQWILRKITYLRVYCVSEKRTSLKKMHVSKETTRRHDHKFNSFTAMMSQTTIKSAKFEKLYPFCFPFHIDLWKDFHQNA